MTKHWENVDINSKVVVIISTITLIFMSKVEVIKY
jgi:hypothetical protein